MGQERVESVQSFTSEINIKLILEEQRKAEARVAEAKKIADEILNKAKEQAKSILAKAQEAALDEEVQRLLEEERRKREESLKAYESQELKKLNEVKSALESRREDLRKLLLETLIG
ncbi:MAG: hypothetical protein ACP5II_03705 [Infirmifilum sp.]|jgi:vacuolar-type H+-ATPase subunit H|uniref:Uncharacterized protein n=1 Tax=Infirmifilum uzonense TaxID=1550241 RepID=A0A0F7CL57_9CREN|nr:hypothetical protein [Infirmifilum uzonense]AKG38831.1 hypothetical protein MA03_05515 [Infirmifilum uzonense]